MTAHAVVSTIMVPSAKSHHRPRYSSTSACANVLDIRDVVKNADSRRKKRGRHEFEGRVLCPRNRYPSRKPVTTVREDAVQRDTQPNEPSLLGTSATFSRLRARRKASCSL